QRHQQLLPRLAVRLRYLGRRFQDQFAGRILRFRSPGGTFNDDRAHPALPPISPAHRGFRDSVTAPVLVDLLLLHWPRVGGRPVVVTEALEDGRGGQWYRHRAGATHRSGPEAPAGPCPAGKTPGCGAVTNASPAGRRGFGDRGPGARRLAVAPRRGRRDRP